MLFLIALADLLGMSLWFAASAVSTQLRAQWQLSQSQAAWLTTIVQLGFVAGTGFAAVLNLADVIRSRWLFAVSALCGALANAGLLLAPEYHSALTLRFLTGFFLAGVYPPSMKMIATWFSAQRGLAIGTLVGGLTVGKATPYLVHALERGGASVPVVFLVASACATTAALAIAVGYRDGPFHFASRPFSWNLARSVLSSREWRLATGGYLGHMWELYALWTWIPAFLTASALARATAGGAVPSLQAVEIISFSAIAVGGIGCVWGGWIADRIGYERFVIRAMAVSGSCALLAGVVFGASFWVLAPLAWLWGASVVADSAQFSTLVTRSVPPHAVGTALTLQTSLGFLLTMVTIQLVPRIATAAESGWRWAFLVLAFGPALGIVAIRKLVALKARA